MKEILCEAIYKVNIYLKTNNPTHHSFSITASVMMAKSCGVSPALRSSSASLFRKSVLLSSGKALR